MGFYRSNGVMHGGDLNDLKDSGGYQVRVSDYEYGNVPITENGALIVFKTSATGSSYCVQIYVTMTNILYYRIFTNNWQSWKQISTL